MADILAIVSKAIFEQDFDQGVGDLYETSEYNSKNKALESVAQGGSLFLVTARPDDQLWLIGILESPVFIGDRWTASANKVKIVDITERMDDLKFENGKGLTFNPGNLGFALQSPRKLAPADVELLRRLAGAPAPGGAAAKPAAAPAVKKRKR
jgi:hypothetical protein